MKREVQQGNEWVQPAPFLCCLLFRRKEFEQEQAEKAEGCFEFGNTDA